MGMTNRQWQGWLRTVMVLMEEMLKSNPENEEIKALLTLFQNMLEDGTD